MISLLKSKSDFFDSRALYISTDKISVYHWHKGKLGSSYLFDKDDTGRENFKRYLQESANTPINIVVDIIEEEFRQDTIPHVFGSDRKAIIERKQSRLFRDAAYFYTQNQGREEAGRRDDRLLFMAINNRDILTPWITLLDEHKIPLRGILSIPLLLQSFVKTIPDLSDHALVVSLHSISGLRQTYFHSKHLQISRLSKLPRFGTVSYAPRIIADVEKIQRYINSLRLVPNDASLDVYFMADRSTLNQLKNETIASPMVRRNYLDINKLFESDDSNLSRSTPFCDHLLMHHLLEARVKNCYASDKEMRYSKMRNIRYAMNIASILLLVTSFIYGGINIMGALTYQQESEASKSKAAFYQTRYNLARERLPKTPVEPAQVKIAVDAAKTLKQYKSTPYEMLTYLGKGLEKFPEIKLDNLEWSYSISPVGNDTSNNDSDLPPDLNDENKVKYYQISNIKAHIDPFDGNYREAISLVNEFAETLRSFESTHQIIIESFPLDISSDAQLQGDYGGVGKEALFTLTAIIGIN